MFTWRSRNQTPQPVRQHTCIQHRIGSHPFYYEAQVSQEIQNFFKRLEKEKTYAPALAQEQALLVLHLQASATQLHWSTSHAQEDPQHSGLAIVEKDKVKKW